MSRHNSLRGFTSIQASCCTKYRSISNIIQDSREAEIGRETPAAPVVLNLGERSNPRSLNKNSSILAVEAAVPVCADDNLYCLYGTPVTVVVVQQSSTDSSSIHCTALLSVVACSFALLLLHATTTKLDTRQKEITVPSLERTVGRTRAVPSTEGEV